MRGADETGVEARKRRQHALQKLADSQEDIARVEQLRALGFTVDEIRARIDRGDLTRLHRAVLLIGRPRPTPRGRLLAAQYTTGPESFLSHRSACGLYGWRPVNPYRIDVTVPGNPRPRRETEIVVHRTTNLDPSEVRNLGPYRVSSVPRLFVELSAFEPQSELERLITASVRSGRFDLAATEATMQRHAGRPGIPNLHAAMLRYTYRPRLASQFEEAFAAYLRDECPEIPTPETNVHLGPYELDCVWWAQRFVAELDGRLYHEALRDRDRDNAKDSWLQRHGFRILRITDFRFEYDRASIRPELCDFLGIARRAA